jgi:hypothetical protein
MKPVSLPRRHSVFSLTHDFKLAAILGITAFATLWLHDAMVMGIFVPSVIAFTAGLTTFLSVFAVVKLPPKVGVIIAFGLILLMTFFFYPSS